MKAKLLLATLLIAWILTPLQAQTYCGNPQGPSSPPNPEPYDPGDQPTTSTNCNGGPKSEGGVNTFNPFTGNLHRTVTDIQVFGGVGEIPLEFRRTTTSRYMGGVATPFASSGSWRHNWQWQLVYGGTNSAGQEIVNV